MSHLHKKPKFGWGAWLVVGLGVFAALAAGSFVRETLRSRQIDREIAALKAESESLQSRNFELLSMDASLGTTDYLEREARLKLNLRKDGEQVVVLHRPDAVTAPALVASPPSAWSNPKKWWTYFTDHSAYDERQNASHATP